ncbi:hypothetical protein EI982_13255 [Haloplanus rallus]|jgi:hypothetical protein|uniref:Uncharacterized protein n=1 Tax=Haloplanus rallus TaxID=1816183 RepID=A0A6B9FBA8_9EURY|nr:MULTISPECIES: hypothetical protein [Haloplanus]QGX95691.1 hypothetical protein EI982_13255 [Haloplanus rallus]
MCPATCHGPDGLDLSREEAWVLHVAILAHVERRVEAGRSPDRGVALLDRVEACEPLDTGDRSLVRGALTTYLTDAPERDREPARSILSTLDAQPSSSQ